MVTIGVTMLGTVLMIVSVNANDWVLLTLNEPSYRNASRSYVVSQKSGLFRICRNEYDNSSLPSVESEYKSGTAAFLVPSSTRLFLCEETAHILS